MRQPNVVKLWAPKGAEVVVNEQSANETVVTPKGSRGLACSTNNVEVIVQYLAIANSDDAVGSHLAVSVETADGTVLGEAEGTVGSRLSLNVQVPAVDASCAQTSS